MKTYYLRFGSGDPRQYAGMSPTFLMFKLSNNTDVTPPSISEVGTSSGIFAFSWGTTTPIAFLADAATTSPGTTGRYVTGSLDPADRTDEYAATMIAIGTSGVALGTSAVAGIGSLGTTLVATGSTLVAIGATQIAQGATQVAIGNTLSALGTTAVAIGTTTQAIATTLLAMSTTLSAEIAGIGSTASSFGNATTDPVDLFGYMKRIQELLEGKNSYVKPTGVLTMFDRTGGTTLTVKTIANSVTTVIKT